MKSKTMKPLVIVITAVVFILIAVSQVVSNSNSGCGDTHSAGGERFGSASMERIIYALDSAGEHGPENLITLIGYAIELRDNTHVSYP